MATVIMVAVRDQAVDAYGNPWVAQTEAHALRLFGEALASPDPNNQWRRHPDDYALWLLGEYDFGKGLLIPNEGGPRQLAVARSFISE